jgi:hypothetical protein
LNMCCRGKGFLKSPSFDRVAADSLFLPNTLSVMECANQALSYRANWPGRNGNDHGR